jgi:type IV secretion system protein TrbF
MNLLPLFNDSSSSNTHYANARRDWNERYGTYIEQAKHWRLVALGALAVCLVLSLFMGVVAMQNKIVPYVVEVDKLGAAVAVRRADSAPNADARIIKASLANWISNVRTVYHDPYAQKALIESAYALINKRGQAFGRLNEHYQAHQPYLRGKTEAVDVEVASVLPLDNNRWRVEWLEKTQGQHGDVIQEQWQAVITTKLKPPTDEETILLNPMGVYIDSFHWTPRLQ